MALYPPVTCSPVPALPAWSVNNFAEAKVPLVPPLPTLPQLSNPLPSSSQPSTPSSHALPSTPPLPSPNAAAAATEQPWAQPTISTFSTSASLHIVQPYLQNESDPANPVKQSGLLLSDMSNQSANRPRRPANAWILYRSDKMKILKPTAPEAPRRTQADISKLIAGMWKNEADEVKRHYERLSEHAKVEHHAQYPTYRFQPAKRAEKLRGQKKARKAEARAERGNNARHVVSSAYASSPERLANSQPERRSIDDTLPQPPSSSQNTLPVLPCTSIFVPYQVPPRPRSSATRKTRRSTRPQPWAESHGLRPPLSPRVTTFSTPGEAASSETSTRFVHHWLEQSQPFTTVIQHTAHSDRSHAYSSSITVCLFYSTDKAARLLTVPRLQTHHEQSSAVPTGCDPSTASYEYSPDPAQSTGPGLIPTGPQSPSRVSSDPYMNLFTHPGASVEMALPADFNFDLPQLGECNGFEQWFGPGGLDIAGYPTFSDPNSFQQPPHRLPHHTTAGHELTKQRTSTDPALHQSPDKLGALAYPTPPPGSPPTTHMHPYSFTQMAAPVKIEHPDLYSPPSPAACHYIGHQQGWEPYRPVAPP